MGRKPPRRTPILRAAPRPSARTTTRLAARPRPPQRQRARDVRWNVQAWAAIATVLAGLMSIPALVISINALKISEQQREDAARTYIQRISVEWKTKSEFTISNSNMTPTHVFLTKKIGDVVYRVRHPVAGCHEVSYSAERKPVDETAGIPFRVSEEGEFSVYNPIDQRLWSKNFWEGDRPLHDEEQEVDAIGMVYLVEAFKGNKLHACA